MRYKNLYEVTFWTNANRITSNYLIHLEAFNKQEAKDLEAV